MITDVASGPDLFAEINGVPLRYRLAGEGPLAIFGHGLMGSIEQIGENVSGIEDLYRRVRLLTYDARGHGRSGGPEAPEGYTWEALGRDMSALADFAGERQAIFAGGSMGAATALWVAVEQPEKVRALVLVMPPPIGAEAMRRDEERTAIQLLDMLAAMVQNYGVEATVNIVKQLPGFAATDAEREERVAWLTKQNPLALTHAIRGLLTSQGHEPEAYRAIKAPTLIVAHEKDGLHPVRSAQLLADAIPDSRLVVAPEPGFWRSNPAAFLAEVHAFLDRVG